MAQGRTQFIGNAGQFYVAYCLSVRQIHAAITLGNAPAVDIIVAEPTGEKALSIQVKTARSAYRSSLHGKEVCQWDVGGSVVGRFSENFWYAFVDLQERTKDGHIVWNPAVYLVPSRWVADFVTADFSRKMYSLRKEAWHLCNHRWDRIEKYFQSDRETLGWCNATPDEAKRW